MTKELSALKDKTEYNELRARDAEARLRIIEFEIAIIEKRAKLMDLRAQEDD